MDLRLDNGLLLLSCLLEYGGQGIYLENILLDTGCAVSIFDIDLMEYVGITPDRESARIVKMYGVGGKSESCLEQPIENLKIGEHVCRHFHIQLGPVLCEYGFDAILGNDFLMASGVTIDLGNLVVFEQKRFEHGYLH